MARLCKLLFAASEPVQFAKLSHGWTVSEKYLLFERILNLLATYNTSPPEMELRRELNKLRILQERQLNDDALRRSKKLALVAETTFSIPEALRLHEFGNLLMMNHFRLRVNEVSLKRERELAETYVRIISLREILVKMYRIEFRKGQPHAPAQQAAFRKLWSNELSLFDAATVPPHARATLYNARGLVLNRLGSFAESVSEYEKALRLFKRSPQLRSVYFQNFLGGYNNLLSVLAKTNDARRFYRYLHELAALENAPEVLRQPELQRRVQIRALMQELDYFVLHNRFEDAAQRISGRENELIELCSQSDITERHFLLLKFTTLCVNARNWRPALRWNNLLLADENRNIRQDMLYASYILNLIIHFELENFELIGSRIRAFKKRFARHREWSVFGRLIFPAFLRAAARDDEAERLAILGRLNDDLLKAGVQNKVLLDDLLLWLERKTAAAAKQA